MDWWLRLLAATDWLGLRAMGLLHGGGEIVDFTRNRHKLQENRVISPKWQPSVAFFAVRTGGEPAQACVQGAQVRLGPRSEEHTSELQSLMRISYAVFCLKKKI